MDKESFKPKLESLDKIQRFIQKSLGKKITNQEALLQIDLIIEEIIVNIIKYGFKNRHDGVIHIELGTSKDGISINFIDNGISFNPLKTKDPDIKADLEKRIPGGLGIFIVKQLTDTIKYAREHDKNKLSLKIDLENLMESP